jgi:hypothetical protein
LKAAEAVKEEAGEEAEKAEEVKEEAEEEEAPEEADAEEEAPEEEDVKEETNEEDDSGEDAEDEKETESAFMAYGKKVNTFVKYPGEMDPEKDAYRNIPYPILMGRN